LKLVDAEETILIVTARLLDPSHSDRRIAFRLKKEIDARGEGWPYRRALVVSDDAWLGTKLFHAAPTIAIGGPGVNEVSADLVATLPSVWSDGDRVIIQATLEGGVRQATLWGVDRDATSEAVMAFIDRGWLDEFLDRCWRFTGGELA
jgi:hypothetical protein